MVKVFKDYDFYNILGMDSGNILRFLGNFFESYWRFCAYASGTLYVLQHIQGLQARLFYSFSSFIQYKLSILGAIIHWHSWISCQSTDLSNPLSIVKLCGTLTSVHYVKKSSSKRCGCGLLNGDCTSVTFKIPRNKSRMPFCEHPKGINVKGLLWPSRPQLLKHGFALAPQELEHASI
jgi:hypothetical protein